MANYLTKVMTTSEQLVETSFFLETVPHFKMMSLYSHDYATSRQTTQDSPFFFVSFLPLGSRLLSALVEVQLLFGPFSILPPSLRWKSLPPYQVLYGCKHSFLFRAQHTLPKQSTTVSMKDLKTYLYYTNNLDLLMYLLLSVGNSEHVTTKDTRDLV